VKIIQDERPGMTPWHADSFRTFRTPKMPFDVRTNFDVSPHQMVQAVVTVLAVVNPVVCGAIFLTLTRAFELPQKRRAAVNVALGILAILIMSALLGLKVLSLFGISLDVFRIIGGMIIAYMGFDMLSGRSMVSQPRPAEGNPDAGSPLAPLMMFAAGPGTITAVVTLAAVHTPDGLPLTAMAAAVIAAGVTLAVLLLAIRMGSSVGGGVQTSVTRFMGLIVASMGMQFVLEGLKAFLRT
jgi:multiple antibiotic resistance protein